MVLNNPTRPDNDYPRILWKAGSAYYRLPGWTSGGSASFLWATGGGIIYIPIFVEEDSTYDRIGLRVNVIPGGGGEVLEIRSFQWEEGVPTVLIADYGSVAVDTIGIKQIVISQYFPRGYYFLAVRNTAVPGNLDLESFNPAVGFSPPTSGISSGPGLGAQYVVLTKTAAWADPATAPDGFESCRGCVLSMRRA